MYQILELPKVYDRVFWRNMTMLYRGSTTSITIYICLFLYHALKIIYISQKSHKKCLSYSLINITHWDRDKIDAISQTTFSDAFSWMKMCEFLLRFHWSLFPRIQYCSIGSDNGLVPARRQAIIWTNDLVYQRIYASLGLNELTIALISWLWSNSFIYGLLEYPMNDSVGLVSEN